MMFYDPGVQEEDYKTASRRQEDSESHLLKSRSPTKEEIATEATEDGDVATSNDNHDGSGNCCVLGSLVLNGQKKLCVILVSLIF